MKISAIKKSKVGLVLSGGGVKGIAHIGVLKALREFDINAQVVSGASSGALVGALYAQGVSIEDMLLFFKNTPLFKYNFFTLNKPGLFDTEKYTSFLKTYFLENNFKTLKKELFVSTTNLQTGEAVIFNSGSLVPVLLASAALPPVFSPVKINGTLYADGGIMNNFPIEPVQHSCNFILGSYTSVLKPVEASALKNAYQISQRATALMLHANIKSKLKLPNLLFAPPELDKIGILDKKNIEKAFVVGYEHAKYVLFNLKP